MQPALSPYIELRTNRQGRERPFIAGTRVRVQDVVLDHERQGLSPDEIARELASVSLAQVHSALAYYFDHKEEVWSCIREDAAFAESMREQLTGSSSQPGKDTGNDSVSS